MPRERLPHTAVLWPASGNNPQGESTVGAPVEIRCRWEDRQGQAISPQGATVAVVATVWVDRVVPEGSILWRGRKAWWDNTGAQRLLRVIYYEEVSNIKGRNPERSVGCVYHGGALPT